MLQSSVRVSTETSYRHELTELSKSLNRVLVSRGAALCRSVRIAFSPQNRLIDDGYCIFNRYRQNPRSRVTNCTAEQCKIYRSLRLSWRGVLDRTAGT